MTMRDAWSEAATLMAFGPLASEEWRGKRSPRFVDGFFFAGWEWAWTPRRLARRPSQPADFEKMNASNFSRADLVAMEKYALRFAPELEKAAKLDHAVAAEMDPIGIAKIGKNGLRLYVCGLPVHFANFARLIETGGDWRIAAMAIPGVEGRDDIATRVLSMRRGEIQGILCAATEC